MEGAELDFHSYLYCLATAHEETAAFPGMARKVNEVPTYSSLR